jgi:hypothetical protein
MTTELKIPRIRRQPTPKGARVVVVRGDDDGANDAQQAEDFLRRYPDWGRYGLSAYYAETAGAIDALAAGELERFPTLLIYDPVLLAQHGVEVFPTFRTPHVTLAFFDLDAGLDALSTVEHERRKNGYHDE